MRLNWNIPLPGPFSVGGDVGKTAGGCFTLFVLLPLWLMFVTLVFEIWLVWWMFKVWWVLVMWIRHKSSGAPMPAQRGWW